MGLDLEPPRGLPTPFLFGGGGGGGGSKYLQSWNKNNPPISLSIYAIIIRRPASALLDKLLCPPGFWKYITL